MKLCVVLFMIFSLGIFGEEKLNTLTEAEKKDGWKLFFDGKTAANWNNWNTKKPLKLGKWVVENGALTRKGQAFDIYTTEKFENFELVLEWKSKGNSGIFLRVDPSVKGPIYSVAPEMQIENHAGQAHTTVAALYALVKVKGELVFHKDGWNKVRIRMENGKGTHWFNGKKIYEYQIGSDDWKAKVASSKFKNAKGYAQTAKGHIGLQEHGADVAFRNIKIKVLK